MIMNISVDPIEYLQSDEVKANPENKPIQQKAGHQIAKLLIKTDFGYKG